MTKNDVIEMKAGRWYICVPASKKGNQIAELFTEMIREGNELKCLLCERKGEKRSYHYPDTFEEVEVPLCTFHYGTYMAHGIKRLDEIMEEKRTQSDQPKEER